VSEPSDQWSWRLPSTTPGYPPRRFVADPPPARNTATGGNALSPSGRRPTTSQRPPTAGADRDFRRTVLFTIAGTVLPGVGLIAAKRKLIGGIILGVFGAVLLGIALWAIVDLRGLLSVAVQPTLLNALSIILIVLGLVWVGVVLASHLSLRANPTRAQRITGGILVGVLSFAVAAPMAVAARYSYDQASLVSKVFKSERNTKSATRPTITVPSGKPGQTQSQDPWAGKPRLNILLLGGDAGPGREGTRTDTVILASIETKTGNTTLFSLPRNTGRMPFPADSPLHHYYPYGFTDGNGNDAEYFLNAMYDNVPRRVPKDILGPTDNLGADVLKLSVGEALGLKVDYYVLINLQGFTKLVNALGGITVNINTYIPIGGNTDLHIPPKEYLHPGPNQHLNGRSALWYARGRYGSDDFARMDRQRCVINAMIKQANPANVLARYEDITKAGKDIVLTDIPREVLPIMVDLSLRVKNGNVRSIVFKHGVAGFSSPDPDFTLMRHRVKVALSETKGAKPTKSAKPGGSTESEDVNNTCAYNPKVAATAQPPR
jgi:polyisoprenyl-teichoic acid--peptidoglycan teichoic acid transferase